MILRIWHGWQPEGTNDFFVLHGSVDRSIGRRMTRVTIGAWLFALALVAGCSAEPSGSPYTKSELEASAKPEIPAGNFRYFGYYGGDSDAFGHHYMPEFAHFTNLTFLSRWSNLPALVGDAERAHALGLKVMPDVSLCFFDFIAVGKYEMKPDWEQHWQTVCAPVLGQVIEASTVFAFFIMDEPQGNGLGIPEIELAIEAVHATFPGYRTLINESPFIEKVPSGVDLYSVGCLPGWFCRQAPTPACLDAQWSFCRERIDQVLATTPSSLEFMLTVEAWNVGRFDATVRQQKMWERFGIERSRFVGLAWFLWPSASRYPEYPFEGTRDNPEVRAHHEELALAYFLHNDWETLVVCGSDGVTYQNPDQAKAHGASIAHYGPC
jgi:hypothetical protein